VEVETSMRRPSVLGQDSVSNEREDKLLKEILNEVRTMSISLNERDAVPIEQHLQQQQAQNGFKMEAEEARAQLAEKEKKISDIETQLHATLEELQTKERQLAQEQETKDRLTVEMERSTEHHTQVLSLSKAVQDLQEQVRLHKSSESSLQSSKVKADERSREMEEVVRRLDGEQKKLEGELQKLQETNGQQRGQIDKHHAVEQELRDLRCKTALLEDHLRDAQDKHQQAEQTKQIAEQDKQRFEQERMQWEVYCSQMQSQMQGECEALRAEAERLKGEKDELARENEVLRRDIGDFASDFHNIVHQDRNNARIVGWVQNGEYKHMVKEMSKEVPYREENDRLKARLAELENEVHDLRQQQADAYHREQPDDVHHR